MVAHSLWERKAAGSNPVIPIPYNFFNSMYVSKSINQTEEPVVQGTHRIAQNPLVYYREVIPEKIVNVMAEELTEMEEFGSTRWHDAEVGGEASGRLDTSVRNSKLTWWYEEHWACSIISHYIGLANRKYWEYDLNVLESIQVSLYGKSGHYGWHSDYGTSEDGKFTRKLSASVLITDPTEYMGGDLEFIDYHGNVVKAPKEKGSVIVFDSRIPHRVTPVTHGKRISLVTWMYGPKLR